ncbi:hypothetical protein DPEC_G00195950 [Dallia pectoralis]|uniref:Uncharacterized protein n=1 Tax=Dallia pectoralis TaxID=75939 RepID=A0ACC2G7S7_DALPE|nr:hypothetical protein DPEC_G00195950 [Dallia pectoralis]
MTASQTVNNNFIKEQKELLKTLKTLEQQQLSRMRQLTEEQKTFAFVMNKRLSLRGPMRPQTSTLVSHSSSALRRVPGPRSAPAALPTRTAGKRAFSANSANSKVLFEQSLTGLSPWPEKPKKGVETRQVRKAAEASTVIGADPATAHWVLKEYGACQRCCCECGHTRALLSRRLSCPALLQSS